MSKKTVSKSENSNLVEYIEPELNNEKLVDSNDLIIEYKDGGMYGGGLRIPKERAKGH